jgi:hypothetical protein
VKHFNPGDKVEVMERPPDGWRSAIVDKDAPYPHGNTGGAYVFYDPLPGTDPVTCVRLSSGGWYPENHIRPRSGGGDLSGPR